MTIKKKKKKTTINAIYFNEKIFNNKRKRVKKTSFNASASKKNNYLNINIIFINELNFNIHILSNDYNILNIINKQIINLIIIKIDLNRNLIIINLINFYTHIMINFDYSHHSFINHSIFIIYEKIYSRLIKNIKENQI